CRCGPVPRWPRPSRCSPSWTRRWWTRNWPGSAPNDFLSAERPMVTAPAQPSPLPRPALDSHTHLDMIARGVWGEASPQKRGAPGGRPPGVAQVVTAARAAGIVRIITVGTDLETSRWSAQCASEHDAVYAAVAI